MRPRRSRAEPPAYPVAGVGNVLNLLLLLEERQRVQLSQVSAELRIGPSTAHRLLAMFQYFGFIEQEADSRAYVVGPGLLAFSASLAAKRDILDRIRPILDRLVHTVNETVHVAMLKDTDSLYIDCIESNKSERATPRTGRRMPSYATAAGKAMLARLPDSELNALFPSETLTRLTPHTIATRDALLEELQRTRQRGFATNENESQIGFFACACPIGAGKLAFPMSIVLTAPSRRFRKQRSRFAESLCAAAESASRS